MGSVAAREKQFPITFAVLGKPDRQIDTLEVERSTTAYVVTVFVLAALGARLIRFANILPSLQ